MLKQVIIARNPFEPETYEFFETDDVCKLIMAQFTDWPVTARIYHGEVNESFDVTPTTEEEVERLQNMQGPFYVVVYPGDVLFWVVVIIAIVSVVVSFIMTPKVPSVAQRSNDTSSPNNELSERTNKPRLGSRIPDIYGTVRSTPDLISMPYKVFINHEEVEYCLMCIGRGFYEVSDVRDDTTLCSQIPGTSVEIYAPFTSPNSSNEPQTRIGTEISTPMLNAKRSNSINGQVLRPPNDVSLQGKSNIAFVAPNELRASDESDIDFTDHFVSGDILTVTKAGVYNITDFNTETVSIIPLGSDSFKFPVGSISYTFGSILKLRNAEIQYSNGMGIYQTINLSGDYEIYNVATVTETVEGVPTDFYVITLYQPFYKNLSWLSVSFYKENYTLHSNATDILTPSEDFVYYDLSTICEILSVSAKSITLVNPELVQSNWLILTQTEFESPLLSTSGSKYIGPFTLDDVNMTQIFANFVAMNGLYYDSGEKVERIDVEVELEATPIDENGDATGPAELFTGTIEGSTVSKSNRAFTLKAQPTFTGRCSIRFRRISEKKEVSQGQVMDEVKIRDVYSVYPIAENDFGNVTMLQSVTYATAGALAIKERKLNMLVTRKLPQRITGSTFTDELYPTNNAADIISAVCLDKYIGNRSLSEVDFDNIYETIAEIQAYFGSEKAIEFCYTFDKDNLSFEETISSIAAAIFCTAYRKGNVIKLSFEKETEDSVLLFNHRNKIPETETRTVNFGISEDNDGLEYEYVDAKDDALVTFYLPEDRSAVNPKKVESIGIRNKLQARFQAFRIFNKLRRQNTFVEFESTEEAALLVQQDRILIADNTRPDTQDGEVISQNVFELTLSQNVNLTVYAEYTIFLQHYDATVESMGITAGSAPNKVILSRAPRVPLALDQDLAARCSYIIVGNTETRQTAFLMTEKKPQNNRTYSVKAANYDSRIYENDKDFINNIVDENGGYV